MSTDHKYFPSDKNHLLKTVQQFSKDMLLKSWTKAAYFGYSNAENPMGLMDDFTLRLKVNISKGSYILDESYDLLAAIYRFKYGSNQLAFLWDGRTHMEFYDETWKEVFDEWTEVLCRRPEIYRAIVKASLIEDKMSGEILRSTVRRSILKHFKVKFTSSRKLQSQSA